METTAFNFWQDHSDTYLEMAFQNDRIGRLADPDGFGRKTGVCGDTVEMYLVLEADVIQQVFFMIEGCRNTLACANALARLAEGKTVAAAWNIVPEDIVGLLETLPVGHHHCAELAAGAFYLALSSCGAHRRQAC